MKDEKHEGREKDGVNKATFQKKSGLQPSRILGRMNAKSAHFQAMSSSLFTLLGQVDKRAISTVLTNP